MNKMFVGLFIGLPIPAGLWPLLSAQSAISKDQYWTSNMAPFLSVISQLHGDRLIQLGSFLHGSDRVLFLLEYTSILDLFVFLAFIVLPNFCIYHHDTLYSIASDQGTNFTPNEITYQSSHFSKYTKTDGLVEECNDLLKIQLHCKLSESTLHPWASFSTRLVNMLYKCNSVYSAGIHYTALLLQ
jgi:hypothetical protein